MADNLPAAPGSSSDPGRRHTVVGIGASAGGLAALKRMLAALPPDSGLTYVVIVHLSPEHESQLAELLQPHADIPVQQVTATVALEPDRVYVIPPNANLNAIDTHLRLSVLEGERVERAPIDHFFRTLARTHADHAIGVILTGTGSDGALGLKEIKEKGGLTVVQDPKEAEHDGMPRSAIATGIVDLVLPVEEIPGAVLRYTRTEPRVGPIEEGEEEGEGEGEGEGDAADEEHGRLMRDVFTELRTRTGRDFRTYKRSTTTRRIARRMQVNHVEDLGEYLELLQGETDEVRALADDLLITVTSFFRDPEVFKALEESVIPKLFDGKGPEDDVRVWCVGCATGEEAYSLAMLLLEEADRLDDPPRIQVFASDLHEDSLRRARQGYYPGEVEADITPGRLTRFFQEDNGGYRVRRELRSVAVFSAHNVLGDPPFSRLDLVTCRNLLIYLQRDVQQAVIELFHYALRPEGFLLLGTSESAGETGLFQAEDKPHRIYRRRDVAAPNPRLPVFPAPQTGRTDHDQPKEAVMPGAQHDTLHQRLVERYAPPSLLVNGEDEVVHLSAHVGRYLIQPGGAPTSNIHQLVREELRLGLRAALHEVRERDAPSRTPPVRVRFEGETHPVAMDVRPATEPEEEGFALVIFDERAAVADKRVVAGEAGSDDETTEAERARVRTLRDERDRAREQLEEVIEKYETSQEEMRAYNEELQSTNEELRSTMEELETSKEELQSTNEELQSVNQEARHKVEELAQLSGDLQNLLTATEIATVFLDRQLRILRFTPKVGELFNVRMTDRGRPLSDLTHRLVGGEIVDNAREVLEALVPIEREVQDQEGRWYLTRVLPYRSTDDRIEGVVLTFIDITTRKRTEERLRESEERYRALADVSPDAILVSLHGDYVYANAAAADLVGASDPDQIEGRPALDFLASDLSEEARNRFQHALDEGTAAPAEYRWQGLDGEVVEVEVAAGPVRWNGQPAVQLVARDVTARKALEERLRQSQKMQAIGHLAAGVAHDFNNLLTALQGHASFLLDDLPQSSSGREHVEQILKASRRAAELTHQLLAFGRKQDMVEKVVALGREARLLERMLTRLVPARIQLVVKVADDDPVVRADPGQLQQLVMNLVVNAADAIVDGGTITIEVDAVDLDDKGAAAIPWSVETGPYARLAVKDDGVGMSEETMAQVFDPFFTTKGVGQGSGLGLSTVYGIVKQSRGHILVDSELGQGTTFQVLLPRVTEPPPDELSESDDSVIEERGGVVLVVEDESAVRAVARRILEYAGYTVLEAADGQEALERVEKDGDTIDLVLSDVVMPGMGGIELNQRLADEHADLRIVFMSGYSEAEVRQDMQERPVAILPKPFTPDALRRYVAKALTEG